MMLTLLPPFTRDVLASDSTVANIFIATFTFGIGAGSLLANTLLRGEVSARFAALSAIFMTAFLVDLYAATGAAALAGAAGGLRPAAQFLSDFAGWRCSRRCMES